MNEKINVFGTFDGMSGGQLALNKNGIIYDYFASEVDPYAIKVTQTNFPKTIQLGDIVQIKASDLPKIDLLLGGSPCQGFSFSGKMLNFNDPRSKLFFEYARLLNELQPKYFLLENVKMKKEYQDVISSYLGVEPIEIDSRLLSAQKRRRLYWTNIPDVTIPKDKKIYLKDILLDRNDERLIIEIPTEARINYIKRRAAKGWTKNKWNTIDTEKAECLTAVCYKSMKEFVYEDEYGLRFFSCIEMERLQTVPDNYTNMVSKSQRLKMLGNGWTIDVIAHILSFMK